MLPLPAPRFADPATLGERLRRGDPLLGAIVRDAVELRLARRAELDLIIVAAGLAVPADVPVLTYVTDPADVIELPAGSQGLFAEVDDAAGAERIVAAAPGGALVCLAGASVEAAGLPGVTAVARGVVTSVAEASRLSATGAGLVVYDLRAVLDAVADTLPAARPAAAPPPGDGREPLVLLSGMLGDASLWDAVAARLLDVVRPWPVRIDLDDTVEDLAESVLAAAPPRFALAGHSLGSIVAFEIVRRAPERVTRLLLVNATARGPVAAQHEAWQRQRERTRAGEFDAIAAELATAMLGATRRDDPALHAATVAMAHHVGPEGFLRQLHAQDLRPDSRDGLGAISVPVTVFAGAEDEVCPPNIQSEIVALCPAAELVTLAGGHLLPLECPGELADVLRQQLATGPVEGSVAAG